MSRLKVDNIETRSGNNVAMDNALQLKSYTTAQRDALPSPQAGDVIYNEDLGTIDFYDGSSWNSTSDSTFSFSVDFLVIAGGGGSSRSTSPGAGAGGYRSSWNNETSGGGGSSETTLTLSKGTNYGVVIGAGGTSVGSTRTNGNDSTFATITSTGGGQTAATGGSGGGGGYSSDNKGSGIANQGYRGGYGSYITSHDGSYNVGGGGGAGAVGSNSTTSKSGNGGAGQVSTISGASVTRGGGGGGGSDSYRNDDPGDGGSGGGGDGADENRNATAGTVNTGGGGAGGTNGGSGGVKDGSAGGSGVVIIRYPTNDATISIGAGLTSDTTTYGTDTIVTFTSGNGTVSFS